MNKRVNGHKYSQTKRGHAKLSQGKQSHYTDLLCVFLGENEAFGIRQTWVHFQAEPPASCVTWGMLHCSSAPQFLCLHNPNVAGAYCKGLL